MYDLVYTTAFGDPVFMDMARVWVRSLRRVGYTGRAVILSDSEYKCGDAEVLTLPASDTPKTWKTRILEVLHQDTDRILFVDSDCVFVAHPEALLSLCASGPHFAMQHTSIQNGSFSTSLLSAAERVATAEWQGMCANTGVISITPQDAVPLFATWNKTRNEKQLPAWQSNCAKKYRAEMWDQPAMQYAICKGLVSVHPIPDRFIHMPALKWERMAGIHMHPDAIIIHVNNFQGPAMKRKALEWMKQISGSEDPVATCNEISAAANKMSPPNRGERHASRIA